MRVCFWGTRGSIPVALTSADIRGKVETALSLAIAKGVNLADKLRSFIDNDLDFSISQTYGGYQITPNLQRHTGDSYDYRFERDGKAIVYSTDSGHKLDDRAEAESFIKFFRTAHLVIFDAMYSLLVAVSVKEDWRHSSNMVGVELARLANLKRLCMFHHEPAFDDERIQFVLDETIRFEQLARGSRPLRVTAAYDGMELDV